MIPYAPLPAQICELFSGDRKGRPYEEGQAVFLETQISKLKSSPARAPSILFYIFPVVKTLFF